MTTKPPSLRLALSDALLPFFWQRTRPQLHTVGAARRSGGMVSTAGGQLFAILCSCFCGSNLVMSLELRGHDGLPGHVLKLEHVFQDGF